jgi:hypothetical protein
MTSAQLKRLEKSLSSTQKALKSWKAEQKRKDKARKKSGY